MAGASAEPVRTFTIGFPDRRYDERAHARAVAERYGTRHEELEIDPEPELLDRVAEAFDEPFGDEAALPMLLVCEATRRHVTVALVGDGGDEVFGGYERYRAHALAGRIPRPAGGVRRRRPRRVPAGPARRRARPLFRARRFLDVAAQPPAGPLRPARRGLPARAAPRASGRDEARAQAAETLLPHDPDLRLVDIESYLPGDLLPKSRHRLDGGLARAALAAARPPRDRARAGAAARARLGQDAPSRGRSRPTCRRRRSRAAKTGFGVPLDRWFRGELARHGGTSCCSAAPTAASSGAPSSSGSCASTPSGAPTTATGSGASACSSSGSGATWTPGAPVRAEPPRHAAVRARRGPA